MKQILHFLFFILFITSPALADRRAMFRFSSAQTKTQKKFAKLTNVVFQRLSADRGAWKGYIQGNGTVYLRLSILSNGAILYSRPMGHVQQNISDSPTPFKFISSVPVDRKWSWRVSALVK